MRRLTLIALAGVVAALACTSDQSSPGPTEPGTEVSPLVVPRCRPTPFPIATLTGLVLKVFPPSGGLQAVALIRMVGIGVLWTTCKAPQAQQGVADFVKWMAGLGQAGKLKGTTAQKTALINTLYTGVGLRAPDLPPDALLPGSDLGTGLILPTSPPTQVRSASHSASTLIPTGAFGSQPTLVTIFKRQANPFTSPPQTVLPPFYEINATNAAGIHYVTGTVVVGFCVDDDAFLNSLIEPAIAHNKPTDPTHPVGGFEVLPDANDAQYASLGLDCDRYSNESASIGEPGLKGFAFAAWRKARGYLDRVADAVLVPQRLQASTSLLRKSGLGGLASSLSPFGVTDRSAGAPNRISVTTDPSNNYYFPFRQIDTCNDGCSPTVRILTPSNTQTGAGTTIHVTLLPVDAPSAAMLSGVKDRSVQDFGSGGSDLRAVFTGLSIDSAGTYRLIFTAPEITPDTSDIFNVYTLKFSVQPSPTDTTFTPADFLGQEVGGFDFPVVQVSIADRHGVTAAGTTARIHMSSTNGSLQGETNVHANDGVANFTRIIDSEAIVREGLKINTDDLLEDMSLNAAVVDEVCPCGVIPLVSSSTFNVDGRTE